MDTSLPGKVVTVYGLADARVAVGAAVAAGQPVVLLSAPAAAASIGPAWFREIVAQATDGQPEATVAGLLDCGGFAGHALAALREGLRAIVYAGPAQGPVEALADHYHATVLRERPPALDCRAAAHEGDLAAALAAWLAGPS